MTSELIKPKSTIPPLTGYLGLLTLVLLSIWRILTPQVEVFATPLHECVAVVLVFFCVMAVYEFVFKKSYAEGSAGISFDGAIDFKTLFEPAFFAKILGLLVTIGGIALYYAVADLYRGGWYDPFFNVINSNLSLITIVTLLYFAWVHLLMKAPNDAYWELGRFVITFGREGDRALIRDHCLAFAVKTFFLPLMFCSFYYDWLRLRGFDWGAAKTPSDYYDIAFGFLMFIDVAFTVVGYVFSTRLLNAHIRWTERTMGGWFFCLVCYMPFWQVFGRNFMNYDDGGHMWNLGEHFPTLAAVWGCVIIALMVIYTLSTVHFGLRFSNLTYRGLISHGTYGLTKHPAYISKNISWWMISAPFLAIDWTLAVKNSIALLGVNFVYYKRAKYEEACLSESPKYREYVAYMDEHSIFSTARIRRFLGFKKKT
jgi:hypothetical protein